MEAKDAQRTKEYQTRLNGLSAIISGGASGISFAMASAFGRAGARVWISDIDEEGGRQAVSTLESDGVEAKFAKLDVTNYSQVKEFVNEMVGHGERVDILFNGAGTVDKLSRSVVDLPEGEWERILNINLRGTFFFCKAVVPHMLRSRYGRIFNVTSGLGGGARGQSAYSASKGGLNSLTMSLARELRQSDANITVNAIAPGPTDTPLLRGFESSRLINQHKAAGALGSPSDMCSIVLYLASPEAWMISGNVISHKNSLGI